MGGVDAFGFAWMFGAAVAWLVLACIGGYVSKQKGREPAEGFILSALLGPLGLLVAALLPNRA